MRKDSFELRSDFFGGEYGCYTEAGMQAVLRFREATGLHIEACYTGKCLAALLQDLKSGRLDGQQVLFWNTYDGQGQNYPVNELDYRLLPESLHTYFESEVQPLDRVYKVNKGDALIFYRRTAPAARARWPVRAAYPQPSANNEGDGIERRVRR